MTDPRLIANPSAVVQDADLLDFAGFQDGRSLTRQGNQGTFAIVIHGGPEHGIWQGDR